MAVDEPTTSPVKPSAASSTSPEDKPSAASSGSEAAPDSALPAAKEGAALTSPAAAYPHMSVSGVGLGRYSRCLETLVAGLESRLDPKDRLFARLIIESPIVTPGVLDIVKRYCEDADRV